MRDMLERLQTISKEHDDTDSDQCDEGYDDSQSHLPQDAVVFDTCTDIEDILEEACSIRKGITLLKLEVEKFLTHNERYGTSVRRLTFLKKDADVIAKRIQRDGEALFARIRALGEKSHELEEQEGPNHAVARIARAQHTTLSHSFHAAMAEYNSAEEAQRALCRTRIHRQASIMGADISDERLDVLVDKGGEGWGELSQSLQTEGAHSYRWALCEIKSRHQQLVDLEARLKEVHELFLHMAVLTEEQGCMLNNIEANVCKTQDYIDNGTRQIHWALPYKRKNPFLHCCPCLPCWSRVS